MLCHHATDARRPRHTSYVLCPPDDSGSAGRNCRAIAIQSQRHVLYDTNFWKTFVHARLAVPLGDAGCLALFGRDPARHRMFADHLTAEFFVRTAGRGREVDEWKLRTGASDNHWFDCTVGCAVAASAHGATLPGTEPGKTLARRRGRLRLSAIQRKRRAS